MCQFIYNSDPERVLPGIQLMTLLDPQQVAGSGRTHDPRDTATTQKTYVGIPPASLPRCQPLESWMVVNT